MGVGADRRRCHAPPDAVLREIGACEVTMIRRLLAIFLAAVFTLPLSPQPRKRRILAIGDVHRKIYQHDAVSHALATIERLGRQSGLFDTYIRTAIQAIT